ncbi:DUF6220 domain-containing protein [Paenibacillus harenae]|uniref:DUF6220 domain-containing protein n=1 Tax=Paenibacillus harenae TaxID=306543 RepID=UPI000492AC38|nr:DUF6220 domain-containing protein [Paenibacillus harenae]
MEQHKEQKGRVRFFRGAFLIFAWLFVACIIVQTFIAGMALFSDSSAWKMHATFVHLFEYLPVLMLICSFAGQVPVRLRWLSGALFVLIFAQYFTANVPGAGAVHPVLALLMFWLSIYVARKGGTSQ